MECCIHDKSGGTLAVDCGIPKVIHPWVTPLPCFVPHAVSRRPAPGTVCASRRSCLAETRWPAIRKEFALETAYHHNGPEFYTIRHQVPVRGQGPTGTKTRKDLPLGRGQQTQTAAGCDKIRNSDHKTKGNAWRKTFSYTLVFPFQQRLDRNSRRGT